MTLRDYFAAHAPAQRTDFTDYGAAAVVGAREDRVQPVGDGVRVDAGYEAGNTVTPFYDPLLAKLIVHGANRQDALAKARVAVDEFKVVGPKNNLPFFAELLDNDEFVRGDYDTGLISRMRG